jgi:hypothetical protein
MTNGRISSNCIDNSADAVYPTSVILVGFMVNCGKFYCFTPVIEKSYSLAHSKNNKSSFHAT